MERIAPIDKEVPLDMAGLKQCMARKKCIVFQSDNSWDSHSTTNSAVWLREENKVRPLSCFHTNRYEPYVVVRHGPSTPPYDERFSGYGKNKIQHVVHLRRLGFSFAVLPLEFLVHVPHPKSSAKVAWSSSYAVHKQVDGLYKRFLKELDTLPTKPTVTICPSVKRGKRGTPDDRRRRR